MLNDGTGTFAWTPVSPINPAIVLTARDTYDVNQHHETNLSWTITVADAPIFQSHPVTQANVNGNYRYELHALDPAGGGLTFAVDTGPSGMEISKDPITGVFSVIWSPTNIFAGMNNITIRATD